MRKQRDAKGEARAITGACAVCGLSDARALVAVDLGEDHAVLCGSHDLMRTRTGASARTVSELRQQLGERRDVQRRGGRGEVDELAEALTAAFTNERRGADRRAS